MGKASGVMKTITEFAGVSLRNAFQIRSEVVREDREVERKLQEEAKRLEDQRLAEETSNVPLKKYGKPEEVALAVEGLLSSFSDHMTGLNIMHDGGFTRSY